MALVEFSCQPPAYIDKHSVCRLHSVTERHNRLLDRFELHRMDDLRHQSRTVAVERLIRAIRASRPVTRP